MDENSFETDASTNDIETGRRTEFKVEKMRRVGNLYCYWHDVRGVPRLVIGPQWPFFIVVLGLSIAFAAINLSLVFMTRQAAPTAPLWPCLITVGLVFFGLFCVGETFLSNPGIPMSVFKIDGPQDSQTAKHCKKCLAQVQISDYHCDTCGVCVSGYDHHCIFYGKCIGEKNNAAF